MCLKLCGHCSSAGSMQQRFLEDLLLSSVPGSVPDAGDVVMNI